MTGRLAAVIGSPVAHSLSPAIHRAAFDAAGLDWSYVAFEVAPGEAASALQAMRTLGIAGLSVTMPHKAAVAELVDRLDPAARALQSVNTVSWDGDDLVGSSTDGAGFVASLADAGIGVEGARVAVIGAGGAARSLIDALARAGSVDITVLNRTPEKADRAAALSSVASPGIMSDIARADIVVNATSVGMGDVDDGEMRVAGAAGDSGVTGEPGDVVDLPCDPDLLHPDQVVADLVYHPVATLWLRAARSRGCRTVDGLGMLVHQAALQQRIWLGDAAAVDTTAMRAAAESALAHGR